MMHLIQTHILALLAALQLAIPSSFHFFHIFYTSSFSHFSFDEFESLFLRLMTSAVCAAICIAVISFPVIKHKHTQRLIVLMHAIRSQHKINTEHTDIYVSNQIIFAYEKKIFAPPAVVFRGRETTF
jgi:hypothetical protein